MSVGKNINPSKLQRSKFFFLFKPNLRICLDLKIKNCPQGRLKYNFPKDRQLSFQRYKNKEEWTPYGGGGVRRN